MTGQADSNAYLGLFSFNWLPAIYADDAQLPEWSRLIPGDRRTADRLMHRVSRELLERHDLTRTFLPWAPASPWMLAPRSWLRAAAFEISVAMISGSVRQALTGEQVSYWVSLIGTPARGRALQYARDYPVLAAEYDDWRPQTPDHLLAGGAAALEQIAQATLADEARERGEADPESIARAGARRLALRFAPPVVSIPPLSATALTQAGLLFGAITTQSTDTEFSA